MRSLALMVLLSACGTTNDYSGGAANLPDWGGGQFAPLQPSASQAFQAPFILVDPIHDLDEPDVVADGSRLAIWVAARRSTGFEIDRADAPSLDDGFGSPATVLRAEAPWEAGELRAPSVVPGATWLLFYGAGGAIGAATSSDGQSWTRFAAPVLTADGAEEGSTLGSPAAVRLGDRVRLYYMAAGALWSAEAPFAELAAARPPAWVRVDGDPSTPERDPMIASVPFGSGIDRPFARVVSTETGQQRHTLSFTVALAGGATGSGFAASLTGDRFEVQAAPLLPLTTASRAPALIEYRERPLLFYVSRFGARDSIAVAARP